MGRVLYLDDDLQLADLLIQRLERRGHSMIACSEALLKLRPGTRVVIASGCEDPNWADFARSVGGQAVLLKPFQVDELAEAISRLLR